MSKVHADLPPALKWLTSVSLTDARRCRIKEMLHAGGTDAC